MAAIELTIPWQKALLKNNSFGIKRNQHWPFYTKKGTKDAQEDLIYRIWALLPKSAWRPKEKIWISIMAYKPDNKSGDVINLIDRICDSIKKATGIDDRWFSLEYVDWLIDKEHPKIEIKIRQ